MDEKDLFLVVDSLATAGMVLGGVLEVLLYFARVRAYLHVMALFPINRLALELPRHALVESGEFVSCAETPHKSYLRRSHILLAKITPLFVVSEVLPGQQVKPARWGAPGLFSFVLFGAAQSVLMLWYILTHLKPGHTFTFNTVFFIGFACKPMWVAVVYWYLARKQLEDEIHKAYLRDPGEWGVPAHEAAGASTGKE